MMLRFFRVCRVSNQIKRPRMSEKKEQATTIHPCRVSHFRFVGRARAGREMIKVAKTSSALTRPAWHRQRRHVATRRDITGQRTLVQQEVEGNIGRRQGRLLLLLAEEGEGDEESSTGQKEKVDDQVHDHEVIHGCEGSNPLGKCPLGEF
jgi:hypothetical protein